MHLDVVLYSQTGNQMQMTDEVRELSDLAQTLTIPAHLSSSQRWPGSTG